MRLRSIQLENFKIFQDATFDFEEKSAIFFGINGTGKSTVLAAINYLFYVWVYQLDQSQSKAYASFTEDMISADADQLNINGMVQLGSEYLLLARYYKRPQKNDRAVKKTYPTVNYTVFKENFKKLYLETDSVGMPIFVHYGTNRSVLDIPMRIREKHVFDKLAAIEHAIDQKLDFRSFFEWYRDQEANEIIEARSHENYNYQDKSLSCVRHAVESMIGNVSGLRVKRNPVRMVVDKSGKEIRVDQLSDGEKCTLALFGDLARRLALANPEAENPLNGEGIVLIDEIELHMHPTWQRKILRVLKEVFPNIQFFITTHSPQVLGEASDQYKIYSLDTDENGWGMVIPLERLDGYDSNMILERFMGTQSSSEVKRDLVLKVNRDISDKQYDKAEESLAELEKLSGTDDADYILAKEFLRRSRILDARN